ncbi:MAG TPA: hypothetical protein VGP33_06950 [Chloroflexota bacterium]|nr:hypothetical protein [Chloroflexota bacterium]
MAALEADMAAVVALLEFQRWSAEVTPALLHSPKRELFRVAGQRVGPARQDKHSVNGDPCPRDMVELVFY